MQFAATAVLFAGAAMAGSTVLLTDYITVTSCAPEITNCPASSTATYSSIYPGTTETSVAAVPSYPASNSTASYPAAVSSPSAATSMTAPYPTSKAPETSLIPITYTTCVPTTSVSYSTVTVSPTKPATTPAGTAPAGTGSPSSTYPTGSPIPTAGASTMAGSALLAAAAGVVAVLFA
ncbi:hypothetical protein F4778DRAFT_586502 [Xylariomycetidae sp. FL2044]|nr:hypothetical protein F4778DRAFT_586502 [Xylariomycetidae sp. FL2044]